MLLQLPLLFTAGFSLALALSLPARGDTRKRAAYLLSNNPGGDNLLALSISVHDGTLSNPVLTPTGGNGLLASMPNAPAGPDGLFGQGAVVVSHDYLFTVNPGSHTLSMFRITPSDPLHPRLVGEPCDTMGEFPMSVAYSSVLKTACVLNGGAKSGVACFHADHSRGLTPLGGLRPLPGVHQTTPPSVAFSTSDIVFNPSSTALFATVKGNATQPPPQNPGYIYAWPVQNGRVAANAVVNRIDALKIQFSMDFLGSDDTALITDATFGGSIVEVAYPSLTISEKHHIVVPFQGAACWGVYAERFDAAYIIDSIRPNITVVDPDSGAQKAVITYDKSAIGGYDTAIDRTYLYMLTAKGSVVVIDLEGSNHGEVSAQIQKFSLAAEGDPRHWQGMAIYPA